MDGSFSSLSKRTLVVPDQGEIEPVRLLRISRSDRTDARRDQGARSGRTRGRRKSKRANWSRRRSSEKAKPAAPDANLRTVTGRVRDSHGRPLFGVSVMLLETVHLKPGMMLADPLSESFDTAMTDREGTFILQGLPQGELQFNLTGGLGIPDGGSPGRSRRRGMDVPSSARFGAQTTGSPLRETSQSRPTSVAFDVRRSGPRTATIRSPMVPVAPSTI